MIKTVVKHATAVGADVGSIARRRRRRQRISLLVIAPRVTDRGWPPSAPGGPDRPFDAARAAVRDHFA